MLFHIKKKQRFWLTFVNFWPEKSRVSSRKRRACTQLTVREQFAIFHTLYSHQAIKNYYLRDESETKRTNRSVLHNSSYHTRPHLIIEFIVLISWVEWWQSILRNLLESLTKSLWKIWGTCHSKKRYTKNETRLVIPQLSDIWRYLWLIRKTPAIEIKIKNQLCLFAFFFAVGMLKWQNFIHHFQIDHDSLCYNHCLRFLFGRLLYPREIGLWLFKIWGEEEGVVEVYYGRCENGKLFWITNHSLTFFRFFSPCIKTANQETRNNHEDAFGRPWI